MSVPLEPETQQQLLDLGADDGDIAMVTLVCQRKKPIRGEDRESYKVADGVHIYKTRIESMRDTAFQMTFGLERTVFQDHVLKPLAAEIQRVEAQRSKKRKRELDMVMRCLRFLSLMRGGTVRAAVNAYGQGSTTVHKDFYFWLTTARKVLVPLWISMPLAGSPEYLALVGAGVFARRMPMAIYNADMTFVPIREPSDSDVQADYYSGKYKDHGLLFFSFLDGYGRTTGIAGPFLGCTSDSAAVVQSDLVERMERFVI